MAKSVLHGELILAIDFDGTITTNPSMSSEELVLQPECERVLNRFFDDGIRLILWTCRTGPRLEEAVNFLEDKGLLQLFDAINDQLPEVKKEYWPHIGPKVGADVYFDDKNVGACYIKWDEVNQRMYVDWKDIEYIVYGGLE